MQCKPLSCVYGSLVIPQRYVLMVFLHFAVFNAFQLRRVLPMVVVQVMPINSSLTPNSCPEYTHISYKKSYGIPIAPNIASHFVYSFYGGYIIGHIPGGILADKVGPKHVLGTALLVSAIVTCLQPLVLIYIGYIGSLCLNAVQGIAQGHIIPSIFVFMQRWSLLEEKSFIGAMALSGGTLGIFVGNLCTGNIIKYTGSWIVPFYVWASLTLLWYFLFIWLVFPRPTNHPHMTHKEKEMFALDAIGNTLEEKPDNLIPWCNIIASLPLWALIIVIFADVYTKITLAEFLPKYMMEVLKLDFSANVLINSLPYFGLWIMIVISSLFADYLINNELCTLLTLRRSYTAIGNMTPSIIAVIAVYMGCNRPIVITLYVIGLCLKAPTYVGMYLNCGDLSRRYTGSVVGIVISLASIAGIIAPWAVEYLTINGVLGEWRSVYLIIIGVCTITTIIFFLFGEARRQPWDYIDGEEIEEDEATIFTMMSTRRAL